MPDAGPDAGADQARQDWEHRIYRWVTDTGDGSAELSLPAPAGLRADPGAGHVRLTWEPVPEAAGYLIQRADTADGRPRVVTHGGSDVPAIPGPPFADTGLLDQVDYAYHVAAVARADSPMRAWSEQVRARIATGEPGEVEAVVDASKITSRLDRVWRMIGSERLTQLRFGDDGHGHHIGEEFAQSLRRAREDLGVTHVRAHAILHDDNGVVTRAPDGGLAFSFAGVDDIYDQLLEIGLRPVVELSFMPAALARDPGQTAFGYRGIISPPADWAEWRALVTALARHLVGRHGIDEVRQWPFEVWNEPNLEVFWSGTPQEYLR